MKFKALLFDCDGVLADSEPIINGVLRDMLAECGWVLTVAECMQQFVGKAVKDEAELMLRRLDLLHFFEGRVFSGYETPRSKPFPDVYLAAAVALGVSPLRTTSLRIWPSCL